ncbi:beta-1,3-glucosyltransferase isoform X1 [Danaus plexippus]|uniref:beta-1,3-glucosyltransferase isoform X1 n=1 Tax=Danaus plexippus TaxID=13037 RepID=UPI002AB2DAEA|nr:beta-1,3-glucosyltransferase isoform X1 [Danaus plexippus]
MIALVSTLMLIVFVQTTICFDSRNIVFTIVSQTEPYHSSVANRLKQDIEEQIFQLEERKPIIHVTHKDIPVPGAWTIIPLLRPLINKHKNSDVRWILFIEPHTAVRCENLIKALAAADRKKEIMWIGYPLRDSEPTIIHHFKFYEELEEEGGFVYPHFASGFAMRLELIDKLINQIESGERHLEADFSIDPAFELAQLVYGEKDSPGPLLTPDLSFCVISGDSCATYPRQFDICGSPMPEDSIFFAVKTWSGFHSTRARVVKKTWGKYVTHLQFFSDKADPSLPAINTGVPNTKTGHCEKTMTILKQAVKIVENLPKVKWIVLADDDTILGIQRLREILTCYRGGYDVTVIAERYGYGYGKKISGGKGYSYPTGGGGTALSVGAAVALSSCPCSTLDQPDDMALGACAARRNITITHSPLFHQARPQDYPREVLARDRPASFHRLSAPPGRVYSTWFQRDDLAIRGTGRDEL